MKQAEGLKKLSEGGKLSTNRPPTGKPLANEQSSEMESQESKIAIEYEIEKIFKGKQNHKPKKERPKSVLKFKRKAFDGFFAGNEPEEEIENTILAALKLYFKQKGGISASDGDIQNDAGAHENAGSNEMSQHQDDGKGGDT